MCGIAGIIGVADALRRAAGMSSCLAHRGRDGDAVETIVDGADAPVGAMAHRRLSVLDLSPAGRQPMSSADGQLVVVFNGEIYNFRALRAELERLGATLRSGSDTEVLLEGWRLFGETFLSRLRGMFAFALWDRPRSELVLARDAFGIKPLYIARRNGELAFASEIRALHRAGLTGDRISRTAVEAYLAFGSVPEPLVAMEGVETLAPGTILRVALRHGRPVDERRTRFATALVAAPAGVPLEGDLRRGAARLRDALRDSVLHHLVSDVPVGLFLSGGVDSSAIVALAAEVTGRTLDTFTVVFDEGAFSESIPAAAVAKRYGTRHQEIRLTAADFLEALPAAFHAMDQPSLDGLNTYVVSRAVHDAGLKVVLSGLGGDEMFGGYASFRRAWSARSFWRHTGWLRRPAGRILDRYGGGIPQKLAIMLRSSDLARGAYRASRTLLAGRALMRVAGRAAGIPVEDPPPGLTLLQQVSWYELTGYMRSVLLRDSDVFSMAHHLELRVPFVDREVANLSMSLADGLKMKGGAKGVLIEAVRDLLPPEVWNRPKQGFTLPFAEWLRGPLAGEVGSALRDGTRVQRVGLLRRGSAGVWDDFRSGAASWSRPWALYTLLRWAETLDVSVADVRDGRRVA